MAATYKWRLKISPRAEHYPGLPTERTHIAMRTHLSVSAVLNVVDGECRRLYGDTMQPFPTTFLLKVADNVGEYYDINSDKNLRNAADLREEFVKDPILSFEAIPVFVQIKEESPEVIFLPTPAKGNTAAQEVAVPEVAVEPVGLDAEVAAVLPVVLHDGDEEANVAVGDPTLAANDPRGLAEASGSSEVPPLDGIQQGKFGKAAETARTAAAEFVPPMSHEVVIDNSKNDSSSASTVGQPHVLLAIVTNKPLSWKGWKKRCLPEDPFYEPHSAPKNARKDSSPKEPDNVHDGPSSRTRLQLKLHPEKAEAFKENLP